MKALLLNYRQAPRKVRLIANRVRGMRVLQAIDELSFMSQKAAGPVKKLLESAVANARTKDASVKAENLKVKTITVDKGVTMFRYMPRARGRAAPIAKEASHVFIELAVDEKTKNVKHKVQKQPKSKKSEKVKVPA